MGLRELRESKGMLLSEMADELGIDAGNLSRIERGKQAPKPSRAKDIAARYGTTLEVVFSQNNKRSSARKKRRAA